MPVRVTLQKYIAVSIGPFCSFISLKMEDGPTPSPTVCCGSSARVTEGGPCCPCVRLVSSTAASTNLPRRLVLVRVRSPPWSPL